MPHLSSQSEIQDDQTVEDETEDQRPSAQRELLRVSLDDIATEIRKALNDAALPIPVFLVIPSDGPALLMYGTLLDPTDEDWSRATEIVCSIVGNVVGINGLQGRELTCAASNAVPVDASDIRVPEGSQRL